MADLKTKEGELTEADLAAYGIPPKHPNGLEGEIEGQTREVTNDPDGEVSDEAAEKAGKVKERIDRPAMTVGE
jgi:hypothetical protein